MLEQFNNYYKHKTDATTTGYNNEAMKLKFYTGTNAREIDVHST